MGRVLEKLKEKSYNFCVKLCSVLLSAALVLGSVGVFLVSLRWVLSLLGVI
jgi:hypothetical protein